MEKKKNWNVLLVETSCHGLQDKDGLAQEVIFQTHAVITHDLITDTGALRSPDLAAAGTPRADLANFVCLDLAIKQAVSVSGFTWNHWVQWGDLCAALKVS